MKVISLTDAGFLLAQRIRELMAELGHSLELLHKPSPFKEVIHSEFNKGETLIFICATGIVLRTLAPVITDKNTDPAVLVLDEQGQFVIPLLSGHQGGANELAAQLAQKLTARLVVTTANGYLKPIYTAGMGCERNCPEQDLMALLTTSCAQAKIEVSQLSAIASIDIKDDEVGLINLAKTLNLPFICYSVAQLRSVESQLQQPSQYVFNTVGVYGVAESAALVSAANRDDQVSTVPSELLLSKQKSKVATCAIGRSYCAKDQNT